MFFLYFTFHWSHLRFGKRLSIGVLPGSKPFRCFSLTIGILMLLGCGCIGSFAKFIQIHIRGNFWLMHSNRERSRSPPFGRVQFPSSDESSDSVSDGGSDSESAAAYSRNDDDDDDSSLSSSTISSVCPVERARNQLYLVLLLFSYCS